jgi:NADH:ubiquinone oxidoreductase subunit 2 (subunit N)
MEIDLNKRHQTLIVLWFALLMNIGVLFVVSAFVAPQIRPEPAAPPRSLLMLTLTAAGMVLVIISFAVKRKLLQRSVEMQDLSLVQKSLVLACAMCEVSALLGLVERFVIGYREYYLLFLLAAAGTVFHFPRRSQLEAATYKNRAQLS